MRKDMRQFLFHRSTHGGSAGQLTLDASESTWLAGDLEYIDKTVYLQPYLAGQAMDLIPSLSGIPQWALSYTWREQDIRGTAKILSSMSDDFPRVDTFKREQNKLVKAIGASYGYSWDEMQAAASSPDGHMDVDRALANRYACEDKRDEVLAYGDTSYALEGLLTYATSGVRTFVLGDKAKGGKTWGSLVAPNATGREVAYDLMGFATDIVNNAQNFVKSVDIVLPIDAYNYAAQKEMSAYDSTKALAAALASPFISSITPWYRCTAANSGGRLTNDTMVAYPRNPQFLAGINPLPYTIFPVQQVGLEWKIYAALKCGGVVSRYPFLISKAVGFGA